jgi:hypothetical protein
LLLQRPYAGVGRSSTSNPASRVTLPSYAPAEIMPIAHKALLREKNPARWWSTPDKSDQLSNRSWWPEPGGVPGREQGVVRNRQSWSCEVSGIGG